MTDPVRIWSWVVLGIACVAVVPLVGVGVFKYFDMQSHSDQVVLNSPMSAIPEPVIHPDLMKAIRDGVTRPIPGQSEPTIGILVPKHCYPQCSDYDLATLRSIPNQIALIPDLHEGQLVKFREWAANLEDKKASESYLFWIDDMMRKRGEEKSREERVKEQMSSIPKAICRDRYEPVPHDPPDGRYGQVRMVTECVTALPTKADKP